MAKKKKKPALPWCYYCEREFPDEKVLVMHQKAKHFKCKGCGKRLNTLGGLALHSVQVHKEVLHKVPESIPGRESMIVEVFSMQGIPPDAITQHELKLAADAQRAAERESQKEPPVKKVKVSHDSNSSGSSVPQPTSAPVSAHEKEKTEVQVPKKEPAKPNPPKPNPPSANSVTQKSVAPTVPHGSKVPEVSKKPEVSQTASSAVVQEEVEEETNDVPNPQNIMNYGGMMYMQHGQPGFPPQIVGQHQPIPPQMMHGFPGPVPYPPGNVPFNFPFGPPGSIPPQFPQGYAPPPFMRPPPQLFDPNFRPPFPYPTPPQHFPRPPSMNIQEPIPTENSFVTNGMRNAVSTVDSTIKTAPKSPSRINVSNTNVNPFISNMPKKPLPANVILVCADNEISLEELRVSRYQIN